MRTLTTDGAATNRTKRSTEQATLSLLTTHGNLTSYLTGGMIFPTGDHMPSWNRDRHHRDPGSRTPEFLPLFTRTPGEAVIEHLVDTSQFQNPVLIEFDAGRLGPATLRIDESYQLRPADNPHTGQDIVVLVNGLIPTSYIARIVFRSEPERQHFCLRSHGNFEPKDWEHTLVSDAERFGGNLDPVRLAAALTEANGQGKPIFTNAADALGGAAARLAAVVEARSELPLRPLVAFLNAIWSRDSESASGGAPTGPLLASIDTIMPDGMPTGQDAKSPFAQQLFTCALRRVIELNHGGIDRGSFVGGMGVDFPDQAALIDRYQRYVDNLSDDATLPPDTEPLVLGLLDFCRSLDPDNVEIDPTAAGEQAMATAILAGAYSGRGRLTADQRPTHQSLLSRIDGLVALRANTIAGATHLTGSSLTPLTVKTDLDTTPPTEWLELRQARRLTREHHVTEEPVEITTGPEAEAEAEAVEVSPTPSTDSTTDESPPRPESGQAMAEPISVPLDQLDWTRIDFADPAIRRDIVSICQAMQWEHLVSTSLVLPESAFTVAPRPEGGVVLAFPGLIPSDWLTHEVDQEAFLAVAPGSPDALLIETWRQLPALAAEFGIGCEPPPPSPDLVFIKACIHDDPRISVEEIRQKLSESDLSKSDRGLGNQAVKNRIKKLGFAWIDDRWRSQGQQSTNQPVQPQLIGADSTTPA